MSDTPRTDELLDLLDAGTESKNEADGIFNRLADLARQFERERNEACLIAGVAAKERGEWATKCEERSKLIEALREHVEWLGLADRGKESPLYQRSAALLAELGG